MWDICTSILTFYFYTFYLSITLQERTIFCKFPHLWNLIHLNKRQNKGTFKTIETFYNMSKLNGLPSVSFDGTRKTNSFKLSCHMWLSLRHRKTFHFFVICFSFLRNSLIFVSIHKWPLLYDDFWFIPPVVIPSGFNWSLYGIKQCIHC